MIICCNMSFRVMYDSFRKVLEEEPGSGPEFWVLLICSTQRTLSGRLKTHIKTHVFL